MATPPSSAAASCLTLKPARRCPAGYEPIHPAVLLRLNRTDIDWFLPGKRRRRTVLFRKAGYELGEQAFKRSMASRHEPVLIRNSDYVAVSRELLERLDTMPDDTSLPEVDRFAMLQTAAAAEVELAASLIAPDRFVKFSQELGGHFVNLLQSGELGPSEIYQVARHDHFTFTHVTNVCCFALILADCLGVTNRAELDQIAVGALLHDVGKRHVPVELLRKSGPLTPQERELINQHPQRGYEDLVVRGDLTRAQLLMIYQHHERLDGGGYPVGSVGEEIHPWARMLAVVDVFDALTGRRPYRRPATAEVALHYLQKNAGFHFDKEMVQCWSQALRLS